MRLYIFSKSCINPVKVYEGNPKKQIWPHAVTGTNGNPLLKAVFAVRADEIVFFVALIIWC